MSAAVAREGAPRRGRKARDLQKASRLKTRRPSFWWRVMDLCEGNNSLRWHVTGLWSPVVIRLGSRDSIYRHLQKVGAKGCLSSIFPLDLAKVLARSYMSDYPEFDNGAVRLTNIFFVEWLYKNSTDKNRRLTVAHLLALEPLSFPMILVDHMEKEGYEFRNADKVRVHVHADAWERYNEAVTAQMDALNDPDAQVGKLPFLHGGVTLDKSKFKVRHNSRARAWARSLQKRA